MTLILRPACFLICLFYTLVAVAQPKINSFTPLLGPAGTQVTLTGSGFDTDTSLNIVYFGSVKARILSATQNVLKAIVPFGTTNQPISVATGGLTGYSSTGPLKKIRK